VSRFPTGKQTALTENSSANSLKLKHSIKKVRKNNQLILKGTSKNVTKIILIDRVKSKSGEFSR
jgi:hypothetical protein